MSRGPSEDELVVVPDVVGVEVWDAMRAANEAGVALAAPDPDGPPLRSQVWPRQRSVVVRQNKPPGLLARRWDSLVVWIEPDPGGLAGVREPRVPPLGQGGMRKEADPPDEHRSETG